MPGSYKILLAITFLSASGCCCFAPPRCYSPCAAVNYPATNCTPVNIGVPNAYAPAVYQQVAYKPVAYQPVAYTGRQSIQRTASLPTMPTPSRRQIFKEKIRIPRLSPGVAPPTVKLDWPITQKYSQCLTDYSLATASSRSYGCQCGSCGDCHQCGSCESCAAEPSCAAPSCAAPLEMYEGSTCAAPQSVYSAVDFSNSSATYSSSGQCSCQNHGERMSVDSSPMNARSSVEFSDAQENAVVPPPAPLPAPPAFDDEAAAPMPKPRQTQPSANGRPVVPPQGKLVEPPPTKVLQPESVPLPAVEMNEATLPTVEPMSDILQEVDALKGTLFEPSAPPAAASNSEPMPIIDLMSLQMHSQHQTARTVAPAVHEASVETETVVIPQKVIVRKRVQ